MSRRIIGGIVFFLLVHTMVSGQSVLFSRLNTSNGLSDNNARCIAIDHNGFVWIGTSAGLNVYDGSCVRTYTQEKHRELASNTIMHLTNDSHNRLWMGTRTGATWMDENRIFHRVTIRDSITKFYCPTIVETASYGVVLHTDKGEYYYDSTVKKWKELEWIPPVIGKGKFVDAEPFDKDKIIFTIDSVVALLDYQTKRIAYQHVFETPLTACPVSDSSIAVGMHKGEVAVVNIVSGRQIADYQLTNTLNNKTISTHLTEVRRAANGDLLVATDFAGLIIIDKEGHVSKYTHDPLVPTTISANNTFRAFAGKRGEVVVGTSTSGANMANVFNKPASYARIFSDGKGGLYDSHVTSVVEEGNGWFWVAGYDRLLHWNRQTGVSEFYYYYAQDAGGTRALELWTMCKDRTGRLWVSAGGDGLSYFNKATGSFTKIRGDTSMGAAVATPYINALLLLSNGDILVGSGYGIYSINPQTLKVTSYADDPLLKVVNNNRVIGLFEDKQERIWIATRTKGAFCYDKRRKTIRNYTTAEGLSSNLVLGFGADDLDNAYIATWQGFSMVSKDGQVKTYDRTNGLRYERCEGFLKDDSGYVWVANNKCLIKLNPATQQFTYYEENAGLSIDGFRPNTFIRASTHELFWGTEKGVNHFFPDQLVAAPSQLRVSLYAVDVEDSLRYFGRDTYFAFPYSHNDVTFHFSAIDLSGALGILYEYKLEGFDKEWHSGTDIQEARYPSLPSGEYTFRVNASVDGKNWVMSNNAVFMNIVPPVWQRWWFIGLMVLLLALIIHAAYWLRLRQIREREKLKAEYNQKIAEMEMKALRAQMNPHFIFNCLNSINRYIVKSDHTTASLYLTRFSKLIRLILDNSNSKNVLLSNELEALKIYIEMESLRFNDQFTYEITLEKDVCPEVVEVPPLIIQPYVENAIWHGLLHKETAGHLSIRIGLQGETVLECVIEDDGVGREKAKEYKSKSATTRKSLGMKLTEDRISILNQHASLNASVSIVDLVSADGEPAGTRVILKIPV